ncbi:MAG: RNA methyltransferase [Lachnospiraceae bacterium]|nr:RNA methyltransferase [Lachnospiraceae bacterium]
MVKEVKDITDRTVALYSQMNESQLKHIYEPQMGIFIAESMNVIQRAADAGYIPESFFIEEKKIKKAESLLERFADTDVYVAKEEVMSKITGYHLTGGILAAMKRMPLPDRCDIIRNSKRIAILVDIENPTNIGAIFRSAAALGMDALLLSSDSCDPLYRRAVRVSMGSVFQIPWTIIDMADENDLFNDLKEAGYTTFATALHKDAEPIDRLRGKWGDKTAILFGSEGTGLKEPLIEKCDRKAVIPMDRNVDSLNVAAASAVFFWEINS